jgi:phosphoenolpyruvate phosphomutase
VPDADVLSWRELLSAAALITRSVVLPVVADCETGFGGPAIIQELTAAYAAAGMAAICVEDGGTPRKNSLLSGVHELADVHEFAAKVRAAKTVAGRMLVFARVQSLVAQRGENDALARARAYVEAGADAIVIHSRSPEPTEVLHFLDAWDGDAPVVLIPTTYHKLTIDQMRSSGNVRMVIYANHGLRAAISSMKRAFRQIITEESSHGVEAWIASLDEAFALQKPAGDKDS